MHVLGAVLCSSVREWTEATGEEINNRQFQFREKVFELCDPLNTNEPSTHDQDRRVLIVELSKFVVFLQNVATPAFHVSLIDVSPITHFPPFFMDGWEPE